jgi:uncharacterized protein YdeI (YjbR/CyaY-like superfamily)
MLATLPVDVCHALENRWEARLAFELLSPDSRQSCIGWIDEAPTRPTRDRRITAVLDFLQPSPVRAEQRCRDGLKALGRAFQPR